MGLFDFLRPKPPGSPEPALGGPDAEGFERDAGGGFPLLKVHGDEVEDRLLELRPVLAATGDLPVIVGTPDRFEDMLALWSKPLDLPAELALVARRDAGAWLAERRKDFETDPDPEAQNQSEIFPDGSAPMTSLVIPFDYDLQPRPEVRIARIHCEELWEAPLHLRFGGWNSCPEPHIHAMMAKRWQEKFGAVIAVISSDTIEFTVERPPLTDEEALALAWEQYFYCSDIVDQGVGSVATLAQALVGSIRWFFWWD